MNKKGLTFMSFAIAVICLSVVLIIVWPKVDNIIEQSKENIFTTKVKDMITTIGKTYVDANDRVYSNVLSNTRQLKDVSKRYEYIFRMNDKGYVSSFKVTNGKFKVEGSNSDGVELDEIGHKYAVIKSKTKFVLTSDETFKEE